MIPSDHNIPDINISHRPSIHLEIDEIQKRKYSLTIKDNEYFDEFKLEKELDEEYDDNHYIMEQLLQFEYEQDDIMDAMKMITDKNDINQIIEYLENVQNTAYPYCTLDQEIKQKQVEIDSLKQQNQDSKAKIHKLQSRITELRRKNQKLIMKHNMKKEAKQPSCLW
eukprot:CAMPEP_0201576834 /NCGR_PEP_ID=MMETSP0190_2-20130828/22877_1 /ASSEMBLY_ACC=CAM_ASM_000263 /TAXON_ID=37353 /ORGANISM="Rosalina sp." /LENGTH=166 /DNA_ID=CAMNT_0048008163 /DNA_START=52 /DNA_END=549 /DNA_ORIENTATION=-